MGTNCLAHPTHGVKKANATKHIDSRSRIGERMKVEAEESIAVNCIQDSSAALRLSSHLYPDFMKVRGEDR